MQIKPKKSLGQNFLIDKKIISEICNLVQIKDNDILEIGPGYGSLTKFILEKNPSKLIVIEKDNILCEVLNEKFKDKITIINEDVLKVDVKKLSDKKLIVFGNLPYNISTEIIIRWILELENEFWFTDLILMFQKEVADRILAKFNTSDYGRLSILCNWKLEILKAFDVSPSCFKPKPKIDSSVLCFKPKVKYFQKINPKNLETVTRVFFNQRRKMIKNPLKQLFSESDSVIKKLNLKTNLRPQNLSSEIFFKITEEYEKLRS